MNRLAPLFFCLGLFLAAASVLCQPSGSLDYRLGPKDLISVKVLEIQELNGDWRVSDDGNISLPLLGSIPVVGLSSSDLESRLEALLTTKFVNRANVSVVIKEFSNKPVSILGAVAKPGSLSVSGRWDLLQAISAAGGLIPGAGRRIYVLRRADNGLSDRLEIDADELLVRSSPRWNIPIYSSDVVNIPARAIVRLFVLGQVKIPGAIEFDIDDRITFLTAISRAGGLTDRAAKGSIRIKRRGPDGRDIEIPLLYRRILDGKDPDPILQAGDVVIVKESIF